MASGKALTVLVHEWVSGGGLAGAPLPPSWAAEGAAMRRAIAADFASLPGDSVRVIVTLDARLPEDPGPWKVARIAVGEELDRVRELARAADFTVLVAPETMGILAELTRNLQRAGVRLLGSTAEAVELTGDKARLAERLRALGIDTPPSRTIDPGLGLPADATYPAVLKPVDGAGSVDTFFLSDARSLPADARRMRTAVLQPFVPGAPMSASFLVGEDRRVWLIGVGSQRIVVKNARFEYQGGTIPALSGRDVERLRTAVQSIAGLRGFVGVDFLWDCARQHATLLEINPRPTTSYVGLSGLLPPGRLAKAWLDCLPTAVPTLRDPGLRRGVGSRRRPGNRRRPGSPGGDSPKAGDSEDLVTLAETVHGQRPLSFDAKGQLITLDEESWHEKRQCFRP
jgi:tyramine---L-glutamate ligase